MPSNIPKLTQSLAQVQADLNKIEAMPNIPSVGVADNGKVLKVSNGAWAAQQQTGELYTVEFEIDEPIGNNTYSLTTHTTLADIWAAIGGGCSVRATLEFPGVGIIIAPLALIEPDESSQEPDGAIIQAVFTLVGAMNESSVMGIIGMSQLEGEGELSMLIITDISNQIQPDPVPYDTFVTLVNNGDLIPGRKYRIIDYVTQCNGVYDLQRLGHDGLYLPYATSAEHPFDLIVEATGYNTYDEHVKAVPHAGDSYFEASNLAQWELTWTHDNNWLQHSWADPRGKGVITWMRDENGNDAPYDFKNIMFLQVALTRVDTESPDFASLDYQMQPVRYGSPADILVSLLDLNVLPPNLKFDFPELQGLDPQSQQTLCSLLLMQVADTSLTGLAAPYDWDSACAVLSSIMEETITLADIAGMLGYSEGELRAMTVQTVIRTLLRADFYYTFDFPDPDNPGAHLDFSNIYDTARDLFSGTFCFNNHISAGNDQLTSFSLNSSVPYELRTMRGLPIVTFQNHLTADDEIMPCWGNSIGSNSHVLVFGPGCMSDTIGDGCLDIRIANACRNNTIGNENSNITLGQLSYDNVVANSCGAVYFDESCARNTVGNWCTGSILSEGSRDNVIGQNCEGIRLDKNNGYSCAGVHINDGVRACDLSGLTHSEFTTIEPNVTSMSLSRATILSLTGLSTNYKATLTNYCNGSSGEATLIVQQGYGVEYAFTTTDGGQTWTPATHGFVSFTNPTV